MFSKRLEQLHQLLGATKYTLSSQEVSADEALQAAHFLIKEVEKQKGNVFVIGNGGSAAIASHFAVDLLRTLSISSQVLSDASLLTCFANDFGYENVYSLPLKKKIQDKDLLVAISSSGQSPNILHAVEVAHEKKVPVITLSGFSEDNPLRKQGDLNFWIANEDYGLVESGHFFLLHTVIDTYALQTAHLAHAH